MEIDLLGPVRVRDGDRAVQVGPARQQCVLAILAAEAGRVVGVPALVERVWADRAPAGARNLVQTYVARLRRVLVAAGADGASVLVFQNDGYRLAVDPESVDLVRFRALVAAGDPDAALALRRGTPLAGIEGEWARRTREALEEQCLDLVREREWAVRNDLPHGPVDFTGRDGELKWLSDKISGGASVLTFDGSAGVGKTALVLCAARMLTAAYPDGQLFLDLQGHAPSQRSLSAACALESLLRAVGTAQEDIPDGIGERASAWRTKLSGRRVLLVLDDVADAEQARAVLPGAPGCLTLITSRQRLSGLAGAPSRTVDVLPAPEAVALVERAAGRRAPPGAADLCGRLPLALRLVGARMRHSPQWTFGGGEAVTAAYEALEPLLRRAFRLLGRHPGIDITPHAAAALLGCSVDDAEDTLDTLFDVHLVRQHTPGRYRMHDLLRQYAVDLEEPDERDAITRVLDHYLYSANEADRQIAGRARFTPAENAVIAFVGTGMSWFDRELSNLRAVIEFACREKYDRHAWQIALTLFGYYGVKGMHTSAVAVHDRVLPIAGDVKLLSANVKLHVAVLEWRAGEYSRAAARLDDALPVLRSLGEHRSVGIALNSKGIIHLALGRQEEALACFEESLQARHAAADTRGEAASHLSIGDLLLRKGHRADAVESFRHALELAVDVADRAVESRALTSIGLALTGAEAAEYLERGAAVAEELRRLGSAAAPAHGTFGL
ncbi:hypothetical protein GCM10022247_69200 [Allokutzneria multivorans]|uniref:OmpR/PhoB-type domain-containing protein n=2 Tax=Allokutzneria multivorans TaxID=1142134 RepID=A0ABP7U1N2_9PSEU